MMYVCMRSGEGPLDTTSSIESPWRRPDGGGAVEARRCEPIGTIDVARCFRWRWCFDVRFVGLAHTVTVLLAISASSNAMYVFNDLRAKRVFEI